MPPKKKTAADALHVNALACLAASGWLATGWWLYCIQHPFAACAAFIVALLLSLANAGGLERP